ncbi:HdeD family acid-resistance protein [Butyrivibrio sp. FC2001]|jgi:uncharacterized membrane protein HdeD (DUF308 family)|uniref:HdeD family acid-resistance protein n=1 Tax=Butyrivibrio sp. FC2001 TaxID=1280671 RepID=UPI00042A5E51|nr:DUF308 domain-containing protein [Butyrivibrio sp. FC2001]
MKFFVKLKTNFLVDALILIAVGALLIFLPGTTLNLLTKVIGGVVLAAGVISIVTSLFSKNQGLIARNSSIGFGLVIAVLGVWILLNPHFFESIIPVIAGVIMLFSGLMNLGETLSLGRSKYGNWWIALILAVLTVAGGLYLVLNPVTTMKYIVQIIGAALAYNGISNLWIVSRIHKVDKMAQKNIVDGEATVVDVEEAPAGSFDQESQRKIVDKEIIDVEGKEIN